MDNDNVVTHVIVGCDEDGATDWEKFYAQFVGQRCKRTSYNTRSNTHAAGGVPFRGNYAGIGFTYDDGLDAFIPPKPYPSWTLDVNSCQWVSPVPRPADGSWLWDEATLSWVEG